MPDQPKPLAFAALLMGNTALAFGPWLVRLADTGPIAAAFWRLALAAPLLWLVGVAMNQPLGQTDRRTALVVAGAALFFAADLASWHIGIRLTKLGNATLFGNISSFAFAGYGLWLMRRWPTVVQAAALLLAVAGCALLMAGSFELSPDHVRGDLLALLAGLFYAFYLIGVERARGRIDPLPLLVIASLVGAAALLPVALATGERVIPGDWRPIVALAIGSQLIGQGLLVYAIGKVSPLVIGLALLTQPVISAAIGWIGYGERLSATDWLGAAAIGVALLLVRLRGPRMGPT